MVALEIARQATENFNEEKQKAMREKYSDIAVFYRITESMTLQ